MKLRGNCPAKVDEKGRLKIPSVFLDELKEYGNQFYITSTTGETARIYPMKVWSEIEDKLAQLPSTHVANELLWTACGIGRAGKSAFARRAARCGSNDRRSGRFRGTELSRSDESH